MSDTQTMTIVEFLTARYDEAERSAKAQAHWADGWLEPAPRSGPSHGYVGAPVRPTVDQILADVAAKRAILEHMERRRARSQFTTSDLNVLCMLASPYSDHTDWQDDWVVIPA